MSEAIRIVTENSVYLIDADRYLRLPKDEMPREPRDGSWRLVDGEWHPLRDWRVEMEDEGEPGTDSYHVIAYRLRLFTPDAVFGVISSPLRILEMSLDDLEAMYDKTVAAA